MTPGQISKSQPLSRARVKSGRVHFAIQVIFLLILQIFFTRKDGQFKVTEASKRRLEQDHVALIPSLAVSRLS